MTKQRYIRGSIGCVLASVIVACSLTASVQAKDKQAPHVKINKNPYPSSYTALPSVSTLITNVTIIDGNGGIIEGGAIGLMDGKITFVGLDIPKIKFDLIRLDS